MCAAAISLARIKALRFGAEDPKGGGVVHGPRIFAQPTCHHAPEIYSGLAESDALAGLTTVPAKLCGVSSRLGTIEAGKRADLIAVDGNPLADIGAMFDAALHGFPTPAALIVTISPGSMSRS